MYSFKELNSMAEAVWGTGGIVRLREAVPGHGTHN